MCVQVGNAIVLCTVYSCVLQHVVWDRVVVDEAHQDQSTLDLLLNIPKRCVVMLTGTPVSERVSESTALLFTAHIARYECMSCL